MNPNTFLKRKQGTYGASYTFGAQTSQNIGTVESAPVVVQRCLMDAKERACANGNMYTGVHINWYPSGDAGIGAHQDKDADGLPIFSYTFLCGGPPYRYFTLSSDKKHKMNINCLPLQHGDCVVMQGSRCQLDWFHGVPTTTRKEFKQQKRVNVTVRPWKDSQCIGASK